MPVQNKLRVAFDTNIWISFTIGKRLDTLEKVLKENKFKIFICHEIISEFLRISNHPKISKYVTNQRILETLNLI